MPRFIVKVAPDRDAYLEWSTVVDAPVSVGVRDAFVAEYGEERVARADVAGTSARYFHWLPPVEQAGGWGDPGLLCGGFRVLPRARLGDVFDAVMADEMFEVPDEWLVSFDASSDAV